MGEIAFGVGMVVAVKRLCCPWSTRWSEFTDYYTVFVLFSIIYPQIITTRPPRRSGFFTSGLGHMEQVMVLTSHQMVHIDFPMPIYGVDGFAFNILFNIRCCHQPAVL